MKKILICGDLDGNFDLINHKIISMQKKNQNFDFMLCVGKTLSLNCNMNEYINGYKKFAIQTYFIDCSQMLGALNNKMYEGGEICENFQYLGSSGVKQIQGLNIAFLSGIFNNQYEDFYNPNIDCRFCNFYYSAQELNQLLKMSQPVDILITCEWPQGFDSNISFTHNQQNQQKCISQLVEKFNPRYHFVGLSDIFYQRPPYMNELGYMSRMIAIAKVPEKGQSSSEKYMYAIQIQAIQEMSEENLKQTTNDCTENPFKTQKKNTQLSGSSQQQQLQETPQPQPQTDLTKNQALFFAGFDHFAKEHEITDFLSRLGKMSSMELMYEQGNKRHKGYGTVQFIDLKTTQYVLSQSNKYSLHGRKITFKISNDSKQISDCWFCISSPQVDKSLILYVGQEIYLALDKGPITQRHMLIIPIQHLTGIRQMASKGLDEIQNLQIKMNQIFEKLFQQTFIFYERVIKMNQNVAHTHYQSVPIDINQIQYFQTQFEAFCKKHKFDFFKLQQNENIHRFLKPTDYYFQLNFQHNGQFHKYLYLINQNSNFPFDFGRQLICQIMNLPNRTNWKDCEISEYEKESQIKELKQLLNQK